MNKEITMGARLFIHPSSLFIHHCSFNKKAPARCLRAGAWGNAVR
jgi:hypothetical protein